LTQTEQLALQNCITTNSMRIHTYEEFNQDCIKAYETEARECKHIVGNYNDAEIESRAHMFYPYKKGVHYAPRIKKIKITEQNLD
jgi:hypothetical protein